MEPLVIADQDYTQMCVWEGLAVGEQHEKFEQIVKEKFDLRVKFVEEIEAKGTNGRHDVFFMIHSEEASMDMIRKINPNIKWWEKAVATNGTELYGKEIINKYPKNW